MHLHSHSGELGVDRAVTAEEAMAPAETIPARGVCVRSAFM